MRRLPIRWRLTVWYAVLLAVALAVFGAALYIGLCSQLYEGLDDQVQGQSALLAGAVRVTDSRPSLDITEVPGADTDQFVRLWTLDGELVTDTSRTLDVPPPGADLVAAVNDGHTRWSTHQAGSEPLRIISVPVWRSDTVIGVLQVGVSRGDIMETLSILVVLLTIAAPLVLGIAVWGGYLLAGRALTPVATITRMAGSLNGTHFSSRLALDLPDDELGRLAQTFNAMLARIEDAFERQRRFTDDAAHELRTPLALMCSRVDLALARPRSMLDYEATLRGVDGDLVRLNGLIGTLLSLAGADSGNLRIEPGPFDLAQTIVHVIEQYTTSGTTAGVNLVPRVLPSPIEADEDLCIQLLVNLLDNALGHTAAGGTVEVGCRQVATSIELWVIDTGSGIEPKHQERVFDRFYRLDEGRARERGGAGLGLSICRAIAEAHRGTIALTSKPQEGTRVEVHLPTRP